MSSDKRKIQKALLSLLKCSLWGDDSSLQHLSLAPEEWQDLYELAAKQAVSGLVGEAVKQMPEDCGLPVCLAAKWLMEQNLLDRAYEKMNLLIERQSVRWKEKSINAVLLKGHAVAALYPKPQCRSIGDVDWQIIGSQSWSEALELLREKGITYEYDSVGDIHFVEKGFVVELHRGGMNEGLLKEERYPEACLCMLSKHILSHAMVFGVGLKQLCDMAVAYRHFYGQYKAESYLALLERSGMGTWAAVLDTLLVERMGLAEEYVPHRKLSTSSKNVESLMDFVFNDGHFGRAKSHRAEGFLTRFVFFLRLAPGQLVNHLWTLVSGRIKRVVLKQI